MNDELTELLSAARKVAEAARPKEFEVDLDDFPLPVLRGCCA
ncbi:MAG: hypothetical protein U0R27_10715 [Candidatus Nanopelagicales bacterium]